ncbi:hypothetical protein EYC80_007819 [Monilinia laxa]|uniref:Uncharacterized protein n=1 Tax=Monilinia laxa TaxID=61186 RepID=A0A5N6JX23_MONLA|nr:hypothetical protein EYC80_007819 [Monilinia laxa]
MVVAIFMDRTKDVAAKVEYGTGNWELGTGDWGLGNGGKTPIHCLLLKTLIPPNPSLSFCILFIPPLHLFAISQPNPTHSNPFHLISHLTSHISISPSP